jgi:5-methyltetrahydrofolate--homocysteine methyltransferase
LPVNQRLERRIIDGESKGLEQDLDLARADGVAPLAIINYHLLEGMKIVGERFGKGEMQLPFVLQSAEVMKAAVALLEPFMEKTDEGGKGTILLATVRGDVHDIGKNLVDIILTNNGYNVVNIVIKQPINEIIAAAREGSASGSLEAIATVSTVIPTSVVTRLARAQSETVDFATSNVRGAGVPLYVAGSKLLENYPVGPLGGVAFNVTLMSYMGSLDVGINIDEAAIESPALLRDSLVESLREISAYAPMRTNDTASPSTGDAAAHPTKRRWWQRSR